MSKKLIYIRIVVVTICLLFVCIIVFLFSSIQKSVNMDSVIEETTVEDKIKFDLWKAPYKQKSKLKGHEKDYEEQLYYYIFNDEKLVNTAKITPTSSYEAIVGFGEVDSIINIYKKEPLKNLINMIFSDDNIDYSQYAFTDNYIEKHPISLKKEFSQYFKENYSKSGNGKLYNMNYEYEYSYRYNIDYDIEKQFVMINVDKSIDYVCEDGTGGSLWGKKGSKYDGKELYAELKTIYFKYKLDEKGYLDDIWFDHIKVLADEKELDDSVR